MRSLRTIVLFGFALLSFSVSSFATETITLMTHDSFNISKPVLQQFEAANQVKVRFLKSGDGGAALIQAILSKENPLADVFFGVDNTFLSRAINADIFIPYPSPQLVNIPDFLKLDKSNRLLPVDYGDVCLNIDKEWFAQKQLPPPSPNTGVPKRKTSQFSLRGRHLFLSPYTLGVKGLFPPQSFNIFLCQSHRHRKPGLILQTTYLLFQFGRYRNPSPWITNLNFQA